ncbi:transporter [Gillisia sp. M10.2A]|uniref:Transporter n=1 Tax=Gillisia lutea TaxID=2909668 RepID=A0ABS9EH05_9FLAO|nr:transporter [Gillisia lutea]MCF4101424.1 transporter [Gillisia lutea]
MMNVLQNIKKYAWSLLLFVSIYQVKATEKDSISVFSKNHFIFEYYDCDVCGCGSSGGSMGYGTIGNANFVGVRYIHQEYRSKQGIYNNSPWIDENFNTLQAWARIPLSSKIQINAIVPYHFHERELIDGSQKIDGLGDISIIGFYKLITPQLDGLLPEQKTLFKHNLEVGAGLKLPTGEYHGENNQGSVNPSFQVGTGSWDVLLAGDYSVSYKNWGAGVMANYTFKTKNDEEYQFGDQFNYGLNVYRSYTTMKMQTFTPVIGIAGEIFGENESYGLGVQDTKGNVLFSRLGLESNFGKFSAGVNVMLPLVQDLNSGNVEVKSRLGIHFNFNI